MSFFQTAIYTNPFLNSFYRALYSLTEPLLAPIRRVVPAVKMGMGYLDLSPIILLVLLAVLRSLLLSYRF